MVTFRVAEEDEEVPKIQKCQCPDCQARLVATGGTVRGETVRCGACQVELVASAVNPPTLQLVAKPSD